VLYSGNLACLNNATYRWLLCDGSEISRSTYKQLFTVIGVMYGSGNGNDTFNLPDFRARFPLGSNNSNSTELFSGGESSHVITLNEMPNHTHGTGTLGIVNDGQHTHSYSDPGHNHGGSTGSASYSAGTMPMGAVTGGLGSDHGIHTHTIASDTTKITILSDGVHTHGIIGDTDSQGSSQAMDIMPPYQTIHYVIRA